MKRGIAGAAAMVLAAIAFVPPAAAECACYGCTDAEATAGNLLVAATDSAILRKAYRDGRCSIRDHLHPGGQDCKDPTKKSREKHITVDIESGEGAGAPAFHVFDKPKGCTTRY
jgi:hypothetical protein